MPVSFPELSNLPIPADSEAFSYGEHTAQQVINVPRMGSPLPATDPLLLVHGGCWLADYDYQYFLPLAAVLSQLGHDVWLADGAEEGPCQAQVAELFRGVPAEGRAEVMHQASPVNHTFTQPVTLVHGQEDPIVGSNQVDMLASKPLVTLVSIAEAGHFDLVHPGTSAFEQWLPFLDRSQ